MKRNFYWYVVSLVALVFAAATVWPHLLQYKDTLYPYRGVTILATDAEVHYAARVREVRDGFYTVANTYYSGPKDQHYLLPSTPELAIDFMGRFFGLDSVRALILSKILFGIALFCVFVFFLKSITGRRWESLAVVTVLFFAGFALGAPWDILPLLTGKLTNADFLRFARPINPQWSLTWFLACLTCLQLWLRQRSYLLLFLAAFATIILVYSYVYAWSYLAVVFGLLFVWLLYKRDMKRIKDALVFAAVVGVCSIPYVLNVLQSSHDPLFAESSMRMGMIASHEAVVGVWVVLFLLLGAASARLWKQSWPLVLALAIGGAVAINQQVVTGAFLVPHHYHWYFIQPLASTLFLLVCFEGVRRFLPRAIPLLCTAAIVCSIPVGFLQQAKAYQFYRDSWGQAQAFAPVLKHINETYSRVAIHAPNIMLADLIPVFTSSDVYLATNSNNYLVLQAKAQESYFFDLWLSGVSADDAARTFPTMRRAELSSRLFAIYYRELGGYELIPDDVVQQNIQDYTKYMDLSAQEKVQRYPLDVIIVQNDRPETEQLRLLTRLAHVTTVSGFTILDLRDQPYKR